MPNPKEEIINSFVNLVKNASNETAKKEIFISFLTKLFGSQDTEGIISQFTNGAEKRINNIARIGKASDAGRADTQYGNVIIEFENDLERTGAHAELQLKEYLSGNWNSGIQSRFTLITSDCLHWRVYTLDYDSLFGLGSLQAEQLNLKLVDSCDAEHDSAEKFYLFLDRYLFGINPIKASLEEIRLRFGDASDVFQAAMLLMHQAFKEIKDSPEMKVAYAQWQRFLSIAYGRFKASETIFLIHSYLSVLAKILAYQVISGERYISDEKIRDILDGDAFKRLNVANFTENDFYRWTARANDKLIAAFRIIANELSRLDFADIDEDILKGVYQELVDEDTRHALGEHYTPDWVCAQIVAEIKPKPEQKILDPSCGSGSFLKACANYFIKENPEISAHELNTALYGIDVHPLSVQISKATLLIAYGKRLMAEAEPLSLNIFLANSLLLPEKEISLLGELYTIAISKRPLRSILR